MSRPSGKKITEERLGRVSLPFFLRPFNGCVPQPQKKRRLFDSHNPNSLMVAELRATISKLHWSENRRYSKSKKKYLAGRSTNFGFDRWISPRLTELKVEALSVRIAGAWYSDAG